MRVLYIPHARERMEERGITDAQVREVLSNPDTTMPADKGRTKYVRVTSTSRRVSVVAIVRVTSDEHFLVYTVF